MSNFPKQLNPEQWVEINDKATSQHFFFKLEQEFFSKDFSKEKRGMENFTEFQIRKSLEIGNSKSLPINASNMIQSRLISYYGIKFTGNLFHPDGTEVSQEKRNTLKQKLKFDNYQTINCFFGNGEAKTGVSLNRDGTVKWEEVIVDEKVPDGKTGKWYLVDLEDYSKNGFPQKESSTQELNRANNMEYINALNGVIHLYSDNFHSDLSCDNYTDDNYVTLGVILVCDARWQKKTLTVSDKTQKV